VHLELYVTPFHETSWNLQFMKGLISASKVSVAFAMK